jgi:DNA-binding NarL/FixJ family response regulator
MSVVGRIGVRALADQGSALAPDVVLLHSDRMTETRLPVVVLVDPPPTGESRRVTDLLRDGARGVVPIDSIPDEIAAAIRAVSAGLLVVHPDLMGERSPRTRHDGGAPVHTLTPREREVLTMLADGLGNKMIAARLGISDHTVKAHVGAIFDKLRVSTRAEAVALGLRLGLIAL